jgi:hypothetical protein
LDLEIPVVRTPRPPREPREDDEPREPRPPRSTDIRPVEFLGLPEGIRFFKDLLHKDNGEAMVNHSFAKIKEVKYLLGEYQQVPDGYWTKERCIEESKKYTSRVEWKNNSPSYKAALKSGWLDECASHMKLLQKRNGYWSLERCIEEAKKYNTRVEWQNSKGDGSTSYSCAALNGWIEQCATHMKILQRPKGYWTLENCIKEALKYESKSEWSKNDMASYQAARKNDWYDECTKHMVTERKPDGYWNNIELCIKEARKFSKPSEWLKKSGSSYNSAKKNGWYEECKKYFKK